VQSSNFTRTQNGKQEPFKVDHGRAVCGSWQGLKGTWCKKITDNVVISLGTPGEKEDYKILS
jgi:hypothetical protein